MTNEIDSQAVLYKKTGNDENFTPAYGVKPILQYIPDNSVVWCPFDFASSEFVVQIAALGRGITVVYSHIDTGQDFFEYEPEKWDVIVSNPPFKNKKLFFERALSLNKPFALIMTNTWLNDSGSKLVYQQANKQMQLLMFNNRMKFVNPDGRPNNKITFSSSYFCCDFLPNDLILGGKLDC